MRALLVLVLAATLNLAPAANPFKDRGCVA